MKELNTTLIFIIPKKEDVKSFVDFWPISLCNTLYKIFTKAISLKLEKILPKLISLEQGGFVPGRETAKGAIVAHEVLHCISSQKSLAMILKLDMMKAYDRVEWHACKVLLSMCFLYAWVKWIHSCISSARFLVILNGSPYGFFSSSRGLRQGDPLSPFLFILLAESFSWAIRAARSHGFWQGIRIRDFPQVISHCLFADDTPLFGHSSLLEAKIISGVIQEYASFSGQKLNIDKSKIFFLNTSLLV